MNRTVGQYDIGLVTPNLKLYEYDANTLSLENLAGGTYKDLKIGTLILADTGIIKNASAQSILVADATVTIVGKVTPATYGLYTTIIGLGAGQSMTAASEGCTLLGCAVCQGDAGHPFVGDYVTAAGDGCAQYASALSYSALWGDHIAPGTGAAPVTGTRLAWIGSGSLTAVTSASYGAGVGCSSGTAITTASYFVIIGDNVGNDITTANHQFRLGNGVEPTHPYMSGTMVATVRNLDLLAGEATAGATLKSYALNLTDYHWNGVDTAWNAQILHSMLTAGAAPKSQVIFKVGVPGAEVALLTLENDNGAYIHTFLGPVQTNSYLQTTKFVCVGNADSAAAADTMNIGGFDLSAGHRTLAISLEETVATEAVASDSTLPVRINGATFKILLRAV